MLGKEQNLSVAYVIFFLFIDFLFSHLTELLLASAHIYGYSSDICRTFFPPFLEKPTDMERAPPKLKEKLEAGCSLVLAVYVSYISCRSGTSSSKHKHNPSANSGQTTPQPALILRHEL